MRSGCIVLLFFSHCHSPTPDRNELSCILAPACGCTIWPVALRKISTFLQLRPPTGRKVKFQKREPTKSEASGNNLDQRRCEWTWRFPWGHPSDRLESPSKETENCGWRKDPPRCCERVCRLVPSPKVCPQRRERPNQTPRGIA